MMNQLIAGNMATGTRRHISHFLMGQTRSLRGVFLASIVACGFIQPSTAEPVISYHAPVELIADLISKSESELNGLYMDGVRFALGVSEGQNLRKAFESWKKAADRGHAPSQYSLANLFFKGSGVAQDIAAGTTLLKRSAEQGYGNAQNDLGRLYVSGTGLRKDLIAAYKWLNLSAASEEKAGGIAAKNRDTVAKLLTSEQIAKGQELSRFWKPKKEVDPEIVSMPQAAMAECRFLKRHLPDDPRWASFGGLFVSYLSPTDAKAYGQDHAAFNPRTGVMHAAKYIRLQVIKGQLSQDDTLISLEDDDAC